MIRLSSRLAALGLTGLIAVTAAGPAAAQNAPASAPAAAAQPADPALASPPFTEEDARAIRNARIAALKTVVELTPEQEKLWAPLEKAIRDIARNSAQRREKRFSAPPPADFLAALEEVADAEAARAADLKAFIAAAKPFVASLTPQQKHRIPVFLGLVDAPGGPPSSSLWIFEEEQG
ncbi:Spy/CpxP family protein refolding chaperone [Xanthobacter tagetidis]|jgi:hypothetical protein|uniref:LTXXQ motif family protein n=1 Tax=Xanthobacter tagetidis TaxID=60216 RepID=A0A3L6ZZU9_9HYPH|nr:Spy/CpxP family protein refolding chaperone [Xanthobacter tagetidis]MBB6310127.1 hypothetical protein [Xanthobacter tagetidis]RLP72712.1 hypothetical protein D9R14_21260 [Xanthobacter tagetidis]